MRAHLSSFSLLLLCMLTCCAQLQAPETQDFQFTRSFYNAAIYENSPAWSYLRSEVKMGIILSQSISWDIEYNIVSGDYEGLFEAEKYVLGDFCFLRIHTMGESSNILNREIKDNYTLSVSAKASGGLNASTKVSVQVMDMNDLRPLFSPTTYTITVPESTPLGSSVAQVTATDADIGSNGEFYYFFRTLVEEFAVHPTSGIIYLTAKPNADENTKAELEVLAVDRGMKVYENSGVSSTAKVMINIIRVNEFSPTLNVVALVPSLTDKEPVYALVTVEDLDDGPNGEIEWVCIIEGDPLEQFVLKRAPHGNDYMLKMSEPADWSTFSYAFNLTFQAKDRGIPPKFSNTPILQLSRSSWRLVTVNIDDVNDNSPQFSLESYTAVVQENTAIGTEVIQIVASDIDLDHNGEIFYTLLTSTPLFIINSATGWVYVSGQLDRETLSDITLKIEARDKAEIGNQKFTVTTLKVYLEDLNDCPPMFIPKIYRCHVLEDIPVGTVITWLQTHDPDLGLAGRVNYFLTNDFNGTFKVNMESGALKVAKELDFEKQHFYNLSVVAEDCDFSTQLHSFSYVEVEVVDVNENFNEPNFSEFAVKATVKENSRLGTSVVQVTAKDNDKGRDGLLRYSIKTGSGLGRFFIDEETGVIYTSSILDCERQDSYWLTIYATDQGVVPFSTSIEVYVQVEDVNDNAPLTSEPIYHPYVLENSPKDVSVVRVQANDPDITSFANHLTYRITAGNPQNFFTINSKKGLITTTSRKLDREQQAEHFLEVTITDGSGVSRQSTVWVIVHIQDVNDNTPEFPQRVYCIRLPERDQNKRGDPVYRVFAYDWDEGPNAELTYSIVDGNEDGTYFIDPKTAMVYSRKMVSAGAYDVLTIKATDNGIPQKWSTVQLCVEWIRKPLPLPQALQFMVSSYNFTIAENAKVFENVGTIFVQQTETPLWFYIIGGISHEMFYIPQIYNARNCTSSTVKGNYDGAFDIQRGMGTIVLVKTLDAENQSLYNLTVQVTDGTNTATTQVHIRVLDCNDNTPVISQPVYQVSVLENTQVNTEILHIKATDNDELAKLSYSIHGSVDLVSMRMFRIDVGTGVLYTADVLDYETCTQHILTIMVKDQEFPYYRDLARIIVTIEDSNDQSPIFTQTVYDGVVTDSAFLGIPIVQVSALDRDTGRNKELVYSLNQVGL
ncbi:hypothetical protein AMELA_G00147240 [Ameiurus melas]|uniref:Cadherin domain-containing protein n=1 Tax=Ameiurus melas TaxID=219545 RepID=A0A7J6AGL0_AMEME|nr:hypothetical protein AMELA_G00147240 [Ameiurus melas]